MRAIEFIREEKLGVNAYRPSRSGSRPPRGHEPVERYTTTNDPDQNYDIELDEVSKQGMGTKKRCLMPNAKNRLPASEVSKCKAKGLMTRDTKRKFRINGKPQSVDGKKVKSAAYGGPIPVWKGN